MSGYDDDLNGSVAPQAGNVQGRRRSSAMAAAAAAAAALYGDHEPTDAAPVELRAEILDSVLQNAANDVLVAIPAQMCVIYTYDRQANLLSPQVAVSGDETGTSSEQQQTVDEDAEKTITAKSETTESFPPTVSMIGACFLQKRCLKMQEPHRHRAFHREHDIPKDVKADSIICAPVIIRHHAIAVIQLLNRLNPDFAEDATAVQLFAKATDSSGDDYREIALHRSHSLRPVVKKGFSSKDEQKLIQFSSQLSQTAETRLKRADDQSATHARIRELQANNAIDLLNILNARLERRKSNEETIVPIGGFIRDRSAQRSLSLVVPKALDIPIDLIGALIAIIRLQARFRARRVRRNEKFTEALETFRRQHERVRSVVLLQRVARGVIVRKQVKRQKGAVAVLSRVYDHYRARLSYDANRQAKKIPRRPTVASPLNPPLAPSNNSFKRRSILPQESELVVKTRKSATMIQRQFRGHQTRKAIKQMTGFTNLAKGLRNIVKLQSVVRGGLVRIQVKRAKALLQTHSMQSPRTVCMRIGMSPGSPETRPAVAISTSSCCVYRLPESRNNAHVVHYRSLAPRSRLERIFNEGRTNAFNNNTQVAQRVAQFRTKSEDASSPDPFELESRRLASATNISCNRQHKTAPTSSINAQPSMQANAKSFPGLVWELPLRKRTPRPPGVEFASDRSVAVVRRSISCIQRERQKSIDGESNNDSRGSLATYFSSEFQVECTTAYDHSPSCAGNATCLIESKLDGRLESSNVFRREAFGAAIGCQTVLPLLARVPGKKPSGRGEGPLLCCLLPAQQKLAGAFDRIANHRKPSVDALSARSAGLAAASGQSLDVTVLLQPTDREHHD